MILRSVKDDEYFRRMLAKYGYADATAPDALRLHYALYAVQHMFFSSDTKVPRHAKGGNRIPYLATDPTVGGSGIFDRDLFVDLSESVRLSLRKYGVAGSVDNAVVLNIHRINTRIMRFVIRELIKNAIVEPIGGRVRVTLKKDSGGGALLSVTNDRPIDFMAIRETLKRRARERRLVQFSSDEFDVLVHSDLAARTRGRLISEADVDVVSDSEMLFLPYVGREKDEGRGEIGGEGLGLCMVRSKLKELEGRLSYISQNGTTTFMVYFGPGLVLRSPEEAEQL
jgi:hypothetical protein